MKGEPIVILLVEDDEAHAEIVRRNFEACRIANRLMHVADGQAALDYLYQRNEFSDPATSPRPGVILLDLRLPKVDGLEVLKTVKADPELSRHPGGDPDHLESRGGHGQSLRQPRQQLPGQAGGLRAVHRTDGNLRLLLAGVEPRSTLIPPYHPCGFCGKLQ